MTCLYRAYIGLSYTVGKLLISTFQIRADLCSVWAHCDLIGEFTVVELDRSQLHFYPLGDGVRTLHFGSLEQGLHGATLAHETPIEGLHYRPLRDWQTHFIHISYPCFAIVITQVDKRWHWNLLERFQCSTCSDIWLVQSRIGSGFPAYSPKYRTNIGQRVKL